MLVRPDLASQGQAWPDCLQVPKFESKAPNVDTYRRHCSTRLVVSVPSYVLIYLCEFMWVRGGCVERRRPPKLDAQLERLQDVRDGQIKLAGGCCLFTLVYQDIQSKPFAHIRKTVIPSDSGQHRGLRICHGIPWQMLWHARAYSRTCCGMPWHMPWHNFGLVLG